MRLAPSALDRYVASISSKQGLKATERTFSHFRGGESEGARGGRQVEKTHAEQVARFSRQRRRRRTKNAGNGQVRVFPLAALLSLCSPLSRPASLSGATKETSATPSWRKRARGSASLSRTRQCKWGSRAPCAIACSLSPSLCLKLPPPRSPPPLAKSRRHRPPRTYLELLDRHGAALHLLGLDFGRGRDIFLHHGSRHFEGFEQERRESKLLRERGREA